MQIPPWTGLKSWHSSSDLVVSSVLWGRWVARVASGLTIALGCLVLIGWQLDLAVLKSAIPGFVTMKVNTAICFVLAGSSLGLQTRQLQSWLGARIANGCAIGIVSIALLTICEYLWGWNLGIDELLVPDLSTVGTVAPGRMGINTAVNFCLTGTALWLINCQERRASAQPQHRVKIDRIAIAQVMTVVAALIALQAIFSYADDVPLRMMTTSMAVHTTLGFESLCAGILGLRSDRGFMRSLTTELMGGNVARRFMPTAIVLPLTVGWLVFQGLQAKLYDQNVALSLMSISMVTSWLGQIRINAGMLNRIDYQRMRSVERLRSSEERLKFALQGAKQGIWDFDVSAQMLTWDDRCKAIFGLPPTAMVTFESYLDVLHPDDRHRVAAAAALALRTCGEFAQEYRTIHGNGQIQWMLTQGRCYANTVGEPARMLGTMMDITDRKREEAERIQAEIALRDSERKFSAIFEQTFELMGLVSLDGVLLDINQAALDSIGARSVDLVGKIFWDTPWWQTIELQQQLQDAIATAASGQFIRYQVHFPDRDGDLKMMDFSLKPVFDEWGGVVTIVAEARDITEQQAAIRALEQAQADLERQVRELDRVNSLLADSVAQIAERNRELDSFAYVVSHDLKAPLRGIVNLSQWIEDDLDLIVCKQIQAHTTLLRSRVRRMEATIDGLLDYARVGRIDTPGEPVVVSQLLADILDAIAPPPTFKIEIAPHLPTLHTNGLLLSQVFTNLISNGIKHHDRLEGSIVISGCEHGDFYQFAVADDGPGIAPEHHEKIFAIFQSAHPQPHRDSSGIGLSIVKKIVEAEGGKIWLASERDRGTTFYFNWPR
jgi:PAS domain S-box-containing protein